MTKEQLIALLRQFDGENIPIIVSSDAEGNSLSMIDEVSLEDELEDFDSPVLIIWPV